MSNPKPAFLAALGDARGGLKKSTPPPSGGLDLAKMLATEPAPDAGAAQIEYFFQSTMDRWVDSLAEYTFASAVVPLHRAEAEAILAAWRGGNEAQSAFAEDYRVPIPAELRDLVARIQALLDTRFTRGAFVKLTTRSPKDSKTVFRAARAAFECREAAGAVPPAPERGAKDAAAQHAINARLVALSEEMVKAAIARTGEEAVTLLLDSARVAEDLATAIEEGGSPDGISLMVRAWDPRVRPQCEFRAFVWGGRLTALGQYWHRTFFPELQDPAVREAVVAGVQELFERIRDELPVPNAMLDIIWLGLGDKAGEAEVSGGPPTMLVEVNPFMEGLGSFAGSTGLFCFYKDADVLQGRAPFELRVRTEPEPLAALVNIMSGDWRRVVFGTGSK